MSDHPYPGARACPVCWGNEPRFTATFNHVTHHSQECCQICLELGIGARNIDAVAEKLGRARDERKATGETLEDRRWKALAEQEARELGEALGVPVTADMTLGELKARVRAEGDDRRW